MTIVGTVLWAKMKATEFDCVSFLSSICRWGLDLASWSTSVVESKKCMGLLDISLFILITNVADQHIRTMLTPFNSYLTRFALFLVSIRKQSMVCDFKFGDRLVPHLHLYPNQLHLSLRILENDQISIHNAGLCSCRTK